MSYLLPIGIVVAVMAIIGIVIIRNRLKEISDKFDDEIADAVSSLQPISCYEASRQAVSKANMQSFDDIEEALETLFAERYMTDSDEKSVMSQFSDIYQEAYALANRLEIFKIEPSYRLEKLLRFRVHLYVWACLRKEQLPITTDKQLSILLSCLD